MAKVTKNIVDKALRDEVFNMLFSVPNDDYVDLFEKINDRQYGIILTDLNGEQRYVRIGAIVAELREDMTAQELMQSEIDKYNQSIEKKEKSAKERAEKAAQDKAKREAKKKESEE